MPTPPRWREGAYLWTADLGTGIVKAWEVTMSPQGLSRRELLLRSGAVAAGLSVAGVGTASADPDEIDFHGVDLHEGTNMSAALSPDGKRVVVDLVTGIWVLPASGGRARRLTDDLQDATLPT